VKGCAGSVQLAAVAGATAAAAFSVPELPLPPYINKDGRPLFAVASRRNRTRRIDFLEGGQFVSIVRVGLAETKNFSEGYDAIFAKKKAPAKKAKATSAKVDSGKKKKKAKKK
jgi:hypothetical protein